jgi:hypothetical protein
LDSGDRGHDVTLPSAISYQLSAVSKPKILLMAES